MSVERVVLFADVSDSSRLITELGDAQARDVVQSAVDTARAVVEARDGSVVDQIGDEVFAVFADVDAALECAVGIQTQVETLASRGQLHRGLRMRIGFAAGPVVCDGPRVFGETVHLARRVASQAKPYQVLTTASTLVDVQGRWNTRLVDRVRLKGQPGVHELREILWSSDATMVDLVGFDEPTGVPPTCVELRYEGTCITVDSTRPSVTIGRDPSCDLMVHGDRASRLHLRVEHRKRAFWLIDQSTNGTLVCPSKGREMFLRREEAPLALNGSFHFGPRAGEGEPVAYVVLTNS